MTTALVVTVDNYSKTRRYVVVEGDDLFGQLEGFVAGGVREKDALHGNVGLVRREREDELGRFGFGARWLRSLGRVDECYRSLASWEVTKVERLPYDRVWGAR